MHRVVTIESPDTCCKLRSKRMIHCILLLVIIDLVVVYLWTHILHFWGAISLYKCPSTVLMKCCLFLSTGKLWHAYGENVCATFIWSWVILLLTLSWMLLNQLYIYIYIYIYICIIGVLKQKYTLKYDWLMRIFRPENCRSLFHPYLVARSVFDNSGFPATL
jgi:hypothetical protein